MKRQFFTISIIRHAILGILLTGLVAGLMTNPVRANELSADVPHPAVARIMSVETNGASFGSGTLVYKQGKHALLVTNHHVIRDSKQEILVSFPNGFRSSAKVVASDPTWDLAALLIWSPSIDAVQITRTAPQPGDKLTIAGYGSGRYRAVSGVCSQYVSPGLSQPHEMVELKAVARQGDSGGPIFNTEGELAGVLFGAGWRTTAGSYSGRVKQFLDPVVGRMQKSVIEKPIEAQADNPQPETGTPEPQATITGLAVEQPSLSVPSLQPMQQEDLQSIESIESIEAIAVEEEDPGSETVSDTSEEVVLDEGTVPLDSEVNADPSETQSNTDDGALATDLESSSGAEQEEAALIEESFFETQTSDQSGVTTDENSDQLVDELPTTSEQDVGNSQALRESDEPELDSVADKPSEVVDVVGSGDGEHDMTPGDSSKEKAPIDLSPETNPETQSLIGWKELAGDTLLQQIRTVLAGVGFLAIVVQLARR